MTASHRILHAIRARVTLAAALLAAASATNPAAAEEPPRCAIVGRANVGQCAAAASLAVKAEQLGLKSFEGRRRAAGIFLPSNPTVSVTGGQSIEPTVRASDREPLWSATLYQELEIAGQRGKRLAVVSAEERTQAARLSSARRAAAADALLLYFDALAARDQAKLAERLASLSTALTTVAEARAQAGLAADVEAQLARSVAVRLIEARIAAQARVASTIAALATTMGHDPTDGAVQIEGELVALDVAPQHGAAITDAAIGRRPEVLAAFAEADAQKRRIDLFERLRVPNPTISVFAKNDWINERLIGVGLSIPIPVPSPIGRTYAGEIAEASALAARADTDVDRMRRAVRLEIVTAQQALTQRQQRADLFQPEQVRQSEETLRNIADEIRARRLPIRDALLTQQSLIDFLFAHVEARRQLCVASVELARALGMPLENGPP